jgi:hypothetical protein
MKKFKDNLGREWNVEIDTFVVARLRTAIGVDILSVFTTDLLTRLCDDIVLAAQTLYTIIKPQLDKEGVGEEDFARLIRGQYRAVHTVLVEEIADFFASQGAKGAIVNGALKTMRMAEALTETKADQMFQGGEIQRMLRETIEREFDQVLKSFGGESGSAAESSASTPVHTGLVS